jgi:hypothetical protein
MAWFLEHSVDREHSSPATGDPSRLAPHQCRSHISCSRAGKKPREWCRGSLVAVRTFAMLNDTQLTLTKPLLRGPGPMAARTWPAVGAPSMGRAGLVATPDSDVKAGQVRVKDTRRQQRRWWERRQHGQICSLLHSVRPVNRSACSKRPCIAVRCTATPCDVC